jgi:hypothetical protein
LRPPGTAATNSPIVTAPGDYDDGEIGGMIDRGNRSKKKFLFAIITRDICPAHFTILLWSKQTYSRQKLFLSCKVSHEIAI